MAGLGPALAASLSIDSTSVDSNQNCSANVVVVLMGAIWILGGFGVTVLAIAILQYNGLVGLRQLTRNAWADVDIYLKRRAELIPNLVSAVQAYASHERTLLESLAAARSSAVARTGPTAEKARAESEVGTKVYQALMVAESYPELKSGENFGRLQKELTDTERQIASARQYYNACVRDLNTKIEAFPSNVIAGLAGVKSESFFELDSVAERAVPTV